MSAPTRMLLYVGATLLIIFTLGGHYRKHYLHPALPVFSLLLASALQTVAMPRLQGVWKRGIMIFLILSTVSGLGLIMYNKGYSTLLWISLISIPTCLLLRQELKDSNWAEGLFSTQFLKVSVLLVVTVTSFIAYQPFANSYRASMQTFAQSIGKTLQAGDQIIQWQIDSAIIVFYAGRPVTRLDEPAKLADYFQENKGKNTLYVVLPETELPDLDACFENDVLIKLKNKHDPPNELVFVKLTALKNIQP